MSSKTHHLFLATCANPGATPEVTFPRSCNDTQPLQDLETVVANFCAVCFLLGTIQEDGAKGNKQEQQKKTLLLPSDSSAQVLFTGAGFLALPCSAT